MFDLGRIVRRGLTGKEPLPAPFPEWGLRDMLLYPASVHLIAGMAGTYKSMLVANAVINMKEPTLIFSTDSDDLTQASRFLSIATGRSTKETRVMAIRNPKAAAQILRDRYGHIKWSFETDVDGDGLWNTLYAYATRYGVYPRVIVVDILSDVIFENAESEWAALRVAMKQLNIVARETGAAVVLVHHVTEGAKTNDMYPCPGRDAIMGKDARHPVLVVTLGKDSQGCLHAACVKLRHGTADATGHSSFRMHINPETAQVSDYIPGVSNRLLQPARAGWGGWAAGEEDDDD